jgi:conjugal transfer/entry exclusion protein
MRSFGHSSTSDGVASRCWWLRQANHEVAHRLLAIASRAQPGDGEGWAARVLATAMRRGLDGGRGLLLAAEMAALPSRLASQPDGGATTSLAHDNVNDLRALAAALGNAPTGMHAPENQATTRAGAAVEPLRTDQVRQRAATLRALRGAAKPGGLLQAKPALSPAELRWLMYYALNGGNDAPASAAIRQEGAAATAAQLLRRLGLPDTAALWSRLLEGPGLPKPAVPHDGSAPRSEASARSAYNHPSHWRRTADGQLVPDASRLQGLPARLWAGLNAEFGPRLAQTMFDAHVRGGAVAVIDAMNALGSMQRLTQDHVAALHFVAFAAGQSDPYLPSVFDAKPDRPHDEEHAFTGFGVSWVEETYNNFAIEAMTNHDALFVATRPLQQQPELVAELRSRWRQQLTELDFRSNLEVDVDSGDIHAPPAEAAAHTERELQEGGYLAHLSAAQRTELRSLLYGQGAKPSSSQAIEADARRPTLEAIVSRFASGGNQDRLDRDLADWSNRATDLLVRAAQGNRLPDEALLQSAARLFAFKLCRARHPDSDLRLHYPAVLREVQSALELAP